MHKYTILATDLDGTLLDQQGNLPGANLEALRYWMDQGKRLVLVTGRNLRITRPIAATIAAATGGDLFLVLQDGCLTLHYPSMQVLQYHNLPHLLAQTACDIFQAEKLPVMLFDPLPHGEGFTLRENGPLSPGLRGYLGAKPGHYTRQPPGGPLKVAPSKIVTIDQKARIASVYEKLRTTLPRVRIVRTEAVRLHSWFLEVGAWQASKLSALKTLAHYLGRKLSEVIAVGDAENDVEMLQAAGLGVAMANASERVKAVADLVIGSNGEAGLAKFLSGPRY